MRKTFTKSVVLFLGLSIQCFAQSPVLIGNNETGGTPSVGGVPAGSIYSVQADGSNYTQLHCFESTSPGGGPAGTPFQASDGNIYGLTAFGGPTSQGVLYRYEPATGSYTVLVNFGTGTLGVSPAGSLTEYDGALYGTANGGANGGGSLFRYELSTGTYTELEQFMSGPAANCNTPGGGLCTGSDNSIYGMTYLGGVNAAGMLYRFDPVNDIFEELLDFEGGSGPSNPVGALLEANDGNYYGVTIAGGNFGLGTLFRYESSINQITKLHDFDSTNANFFNYYDGYYYVNYKLLQVGDDLYGVAPGGGVFGAGVIFKYSLTAGTLQNVHDFETLGGNFPAVTSNLIIGNDGKLYGLTTSDGPFAGGSAYSFDPATGAFNTLIVFDEIWSQGRLPYGGFLNASDGNIYTATSDAGPYSPGGWGVLIQYNTQSTQFTNVSAFNGIKNGGRPKGKLTLAGNGKLYGIAEGGTNETGLLYSVNPDGSQFVKEYEFPSADLGIYPKPSLLLGSDGKLYGAASGGNGYKSAGVIFSYDVTTNTYQKLFDFNGLSQGHLPNGGLMEFEPGLLIGTTRFGGNSTIVDTTFQSDITFNGAGVIYSYNIQTGAYQKLHGFDGADNGKAPIGDLLKGRDGQIYGITEWGGLYNSTSGVAAGGILYRFNPAQNLFVKLHDFGLLGNNPQSGASLTNDGLIVGNARNGSQERGMYIWDPNEALFKEPIHAWPFDPPGNGYVAASDGKLYATGEDMQNYGPSRIVAVDPASLAIQQVATTTGAALDLLYSKSQLIELPAVKDLGVLSAHLSNGLNTTCNNENSFTAYIKNWGVAPIDTATIYYRINQGATQSIQWSGNLYTGQSAQINLASIACATGMNTLQVFCPSQDGIAGNDTASLAFEVFGPSAATSSLQEAFTASAFPPLNWELTNAYHPRTWQRTDTAYHSAPSCMTINNDFIWSQGMQDDIELPEINLSALTNPTLKFWRAYSLYTNPSSNPNFSDTLEVLISIDCGETYQRIYQKYGTALTTTTPPFTQSLFVPSSNEWEQDSIDLIPFAQTSNALIKFRNTSNYENAMYLDDIQIEGATGISPLESQPRIALYPNPTQGIFTLRVDGKTSEKFNVVISNALGTNIYKKSVESNSLQEVINLSGYAQGVYQIRIETQNGNWSKQLVLID